MSFTLAGQTHRGSVRQHNEDCIHAEPLAADAALLLVADGLGGAGGGAQASRLCVDTMVTLLRACGEVARRDVAEALLRQAAAAANDAIWQTRQAVPGLENMSTTLVAALLFYEQGSPLGVVLHVGDSRAYLRQAGDAGSEPRLVQLTADHSVAQSLLEQDAINAVQAEQSPLRHVLTHSMGGAQVLHCDTSCIELSPRQTLLLCSDGLYDVLPLPQLCAQSGGPAPLAQRAEGLIEQCLMRGAQDNVSAVLAELD